MRVPEPHASTPVTRELDGLGVPYRLFRHPGTLASLEQAAAERQQRPDQVIRSIVFRCGAGAFVMVLVAGTRQVDWRALRRYLGQSRLTTASQAELLCATGYEIGAVAPFGLPRPIRILIDASVLEQDEISIGSGERGLAVVLRAEHLRAALPQAEVGNFANG
jgi:Cys-tRNA(Pro)/Cys-tRNA(Cys) deacylase